MSNPVRDVVPLIEGRRALAVWDNALRSKSISRSKEPTTNSVGLARAGLAVKASTAPGGSGYDDRAFVRLVQGQNMGISNKVMEGLTFTGVAQSWEPEDPLPSLNRYVAMDGNTQVPRLRGPNSIYDVGILNLAAGAVIPAGNVAGGGGVGRRAAASRTDWLDTIQMRPGAAGGPQLVIYSKYPLTIAIDVPVSTFTYNSPAGGAIVYMGYDTGAVNGALTVQNSAFGPNEQVPGAGGVIPPDVTQWKTYGTPQTVAPGTSRVFNIHQQSGILVPAHAANADFTIRVLNSVPYANMDVQAVFAPNQETNKPSLPTSRKTDVSLPQWVSGTRQEAPKFEVDTARYGAMASACAANIMESGTYNGYSTSIGRVDTTTGK